MCVVVYKKSSIKFTIHFLFSSYLSNLENELRVDEMQIERKEKIQQTKAQAKEDAVFAAKCKLILFCTGTSTV